jgi:formate hydrogenlyase subunit 6/NADH:ubiquinone oxidoreductase subunit I
MDEAGNTKDDLSLPKGTDDAEKLAQQIKDDFDAGKELVVTVLKVCIPTRITKPGPDWHTFGLQVYRAHWLLLPSCVPCRLCLAVCPHARIWYCCVAVYG